MDYIIELCFFYYIIKAGSERREKESFILERAALNFKGSFWTGNTIKRHWNLFHKAFKWIKKGGRKWMKTEEGSFLIWIFDFFLLIFIGNHFECSENIKGKKKKDYMLPKRQTLSTAVKKCLPRASSCFGRRRPSLKFRGHFLVGKKVWLKKESGKGLSEWLSIFVAQGAEEEEEPDTSLKVST